ncbi:MAG: arginine--tRNA ligase, partial [Oscillospiraceae bacterium]|nr:arginine--tRNA ligase [Oscillospiraceae bacterium]
ALSDAAINGNLPDTHDTRLIIEAPKDPAKGDLACNAALVLSSEFKLPPRNIAAIISEELTLDKSVFEKVEIAGPGFINFFLSSEFYAFALEGILREKDDYGKLGVGRGEKYMVEFVSANPTGPMHLGNARGGALGDCLASVLGAAGYEVTREFYVNDAGSQIEKFALSLEARYLALFDEDFPFPEDGYHGRDIEAHAVEFAEIHKDGYVKKPAEERRQALVDFALPLNLERMKSDLHEYRIDFDVWFRESRLHRAKTVEKVLELLRQRDALYEKDGALWYRATEYGGEKDEVLVRASGYPTYFAVDIAYHYNKFAERGFERVINIWGADHHGHVARLKSAMDALGLDGKKLDIVINQMVNLMQGGEPARMSKRTGKAITLSTLLDEIPVDAARFFFNLREPKSHLDFDLDLAAKQDSENPVYYVQYAHARICSILKGLEAGGIDVGEAHNYDFSALTAFEERRLIMHLIGLPGEIAAAAREYDPAKITRYTIELAAQFHKFYTNCRVKGEENSVMYPRIALCVASRQVIRNCLSLLKISAPESM